MEFTGKLGKFLETSFGLCDSGNKRNNEKIFGITRVNMVTYGSVKDDQGQCIEPIINHLVWLIQRMHADQDSYRWTHGMMD
jgi:hypothetical protein